MGILSLSTLRKDAVNKLKNVLFIALLFLTSNWLSVSIASLKFEINGIISSVKLSLMIFVFILVPLCGIQFVISRVSEKNFNKFYMFSVVIVVAVCIVQIMLIFGIKNIISDYYSSTLFKYLEGSWSGTTLVKSNALTEFRIKGTFYEPAVLSTFFTMYVFPYILCRYINGQYLLGKVYDFIIILLSFGCLIFSFSTTSYILATIDLIIIFYFSFRNKLTIKRIILIAILITVSVNVVTTYYETYYRIVNRVLLFKSNKDISSSTRIGSIAGAINLFKDNPLGVGFANEKYIVYDYTPKWGMTKEVTRERSNIQSTYFRYLADFGIPWIILSVAGILNVFLSYHHKKKYLFKWQREAILLWVSNFLINSTFGFVEYHSQWFLLSAVTVLGPIYKNYKKEILING